MTSNKNTRLIIKNGRWLLGGLVAGAIIGVITGIAVTKIEPTQHKTTIEQSKLAAQTLGWDSLDKITAASKAFDSKNDTKLIQNLGIALNQAYAKLGKPQQKPVVLAKPPVTTATIIQTTPKIEKPEQTVASTPKIANTGKYADGTGEIDINTATLQQIDDVPRMSTTTAKDIYNFIHQKGPIKSFSDLDSIKNVGEKTLEKLRLMFHIKK